MYQKYTRGACDVISLTYFNDSRILISIKYIRVFNWAADKDECDKCVCVCVCASWNCTCNAAIQIIYTIYYIFLYYISISAFIARDCEICNNASLSDAVTMLPQGTVARFQPSSKCHLYPTPCPMPHAPRLMPQWQLEKRAGGASKPVAGSRLSCS